MNRLWIVTIDDRDYENEAFTTAVVWAEHHNQAKALVKAELELPGKGRLSARLAPATGIVMSELASA